MSKLYMLETLPSWNSARTPLSFAATALNLGALLTSLVVQTGHGPGPYTGLLLVISAAIVLGQILLPFPFRRDQRGHRHGQGPSLRPPAGPSRQLRFGKLVFLSLGFVSIATGLIAGDSSLEGGIGRGTPVLPVALAFLLVLAGEIAGRFLFYGIVPRLGD